MADRMQLWTEALSDSLRRLQVGWGLDQSGIATVLDRLRPRMVSMPDPNAKLRNADLVSIELTGIPFHTDDNVIVSGGGVILAHSQWTYGAVLTQKLADDELVAIIPDRVSPQTRAVRDRHEAELQRQDTQADRLDVPSICPKCGAYWDCDCE